MARTKSPKPKRDDTATAGKSPDISDTDRNTLVEPKWGVADATRLVEAVREAGGRVPSRYNRPEYDSDPAELERWREAMNDLGTSTSCAFTISEIWPETTNQQWRNKRLKTATEIQGQLSRIRERLSKDPYLCERIDDHLPEDYATVGQLICELLDAVKELERQLASPVPLSETKTTALDQTIESLRRTYIESFESDPSTDTMKTWNQHSGPYIEFLTTAFELADAPKSLATLTKAIQRSEAAIAKGH